MTLGWGIAATGRIARDVGEVIARHPDMAVTAVASRSLDRARGLAAHLGDGSAYDSYQQLVDDPAVQAVYVATPHAQHAEVVELALTAGKPVLCEKPMTHDLRESERLVALSESTGTFLMEGLWMRFNPLVQQLVERLDELGPLRSVHATFGFVAPDDPTSRLWDPALGGGAVLDLAVYTVDLARLLLGEPTSVTATGSLHPIGVDAEETLHLTFASGAHAQLDTSLIARLPGTALIVGVRGWAELGPSFHAPTRLRLQVAGAQPEEHTIADRSAGFVGELEEVARCLSLGLRESTVNPLSETLGTLRVLDEALTQLHA
jgi:predicted dehydrogenase